MTYVDNIRVWDPVIRISHWLIVASFFTAYFSRESYIHLHSLAGYTLGTVVTIRIIWGFVGSYHARFSNFVSTPSRAVRYVIDSLQNNAERYHGHNPAGGLMVVVILVMLILLAVSGIVLYAAQEQAGPAAAWFVDSSDRFDETIETIHEVISDLLIVLLGIHLSGILIESLLHRENLVRAMINGYKKA